MDAIGYFEKYSDGSPVFAGGYSHIPNMPPMATFTQPNLSDELKYNCACDKYRREFNRATEFLPAIRAVHSFWLRLNHNNGYAERQKRFGREP